MTVAHRMSSSHTPLWLALAVVVGLGLRGALTWTTGGNPFDLESMHVAAETLRGTEPLRLYETVNQGMFPRWPYPPGALPVIVPLDVLAGAVGLEPGRVFRLGLSVVDLPVALGIGIHLHRRGSSAWPVAVALVLVGPSFVLLSGFHGQLDLVAFLPALAGVAAWARGHVGPWDVPPDRRWLVTGALIGIGAAVKTAPGLLLLAVLPTARDRREAVSTTAVAVAVPAALLAPFAAATPAAVVDALGYRGLPGLGGLSLLLHPHLAVQWLTRSPVDIDTITSTERLATTVLLVAALGVSTIVARRRHAPADDTSVVVLLAVLAFGGNFAVGYAVWLLLALLVAGRVGWAVAVQLAIVVPLVMVEATAITQGWSTGLVWSVYVPTMAVLSLAAAGAWAYAIAAPPAARSRLSLPHNPLGPPPRP